MILLDQSYWSVFHSPGKGRGIKAKKSIPKGTIIGDYTGKVISPEEDSDSHGVYGMSWSDTFVIMPNKRGIGLHVINHSCEPNCTMYPYHGHMLYVSLRKILPGEELTVSYMIEPGPDPKGWYKCRCLTPTCRGTMMTTAKKAKAFWDDYIRVRQGKFADTPPVPIGEKLQRFRSYPALVHPVDYH